MSMSALFTTVLLAQAASGAPGIGQMLIPLVLVMGVFWLLIWRPQAKAQAKHQEILSGLKVGDEVVTDAGLYGKIASIDDQQIVMEISKGVKVKVRRQNIEDLANREKLEKTEKSEKTKNDKSQKTEKAEKSEKAEKDTTSDTDEKSW